MSRRSDKRKIKSSLHNQQCYISRFYGATPTESIQTIFGKSGDCGSVINSANYHFDQSTGLGLAGTGIYRVSIGKQQVILNVVLGADALARDKTESCEIA